MLQANPQDFEFSGTCAACGEVTNVTLTKKTAAFFHVLGSSFICGSCGCERAKSSSCPIPDIDQELLEIWLEDEGLCFLDQDEELIVSGAPALELINAFRKANSKFRSAQIAISIAIRFHDERYGSEDEQTLMEDWLRTNVDTWRRPFDYEYVADATAKRLGLQ